MEEMAHTSTALALKWLLEFPLCTRVEIGYCRVHSSLSMNDQIGGQRWLTLFAWLNRFDGTDMPLRPDLRGEVEHDVGITGVIDYAK